MAKPTDNQQAEKQPVTCELRDQLHQQLKLIATVEKKPLRAIVDEAVSDWVKRNPKRLTAALKHLRDWNY